MQNNKIFSIRILTITALIGNINLTMAQETDVQKPRPTFGLEYTGEVQTDFKRLKSVNLLELGAQLPLTSKLSVELGSISVLTTDEDILTNCLQNFSSIDAPNIPFALTTAGLAWQINERHHVFAGIHRIDDNYFCSDMLGLFTHSSCGAFPTITANYDIAAFPVAALGIHYGYTKDAFSLETSLYNGVGYKDFSKRDNVFRICPESDGVFLMAQGEYDKNATRAYVGGQRALQRLARYGAKADAPRCLGLCRAGYYRTFLRACRIFARLQQRHHLPRLLSRLRQVCVQEGRVRRVLFLHTHRRKGRVGD